MTAADFEKEWSQMEKDMAFFGEIVYTIAIIT